MKASGNEPKNQDGNKAWVDFVTMLPHSAKFHAMQGLGHTVERYKVFNPMTGQHVEAATLGEATALCATLRAEYIELHVKPMFCYSQAFVTATGDELWVTGNV